MNTTRKPKPYVPPYDEHFLVSPEKVLQLVEAHVRKKYMKTGRRIQKLGIEPMVHFTPAKDYFFDGYHVEVKLEKGGKDEKGERV